MWADLAINYPLVSWPFYLALYFVELVSIVVFFRPQLHRAWGIALILFHFGTLLFMDIVFGRHVIVNGLLFVMSPFALGRHSVHQQFESVPLLGAFYSMIRNPRLVRPRVKAKPPQSSGVVDPVPAPSFNVQSATEHIQA